MSNSLGVFEEGKLSNRWLLKLAEMACWMPEHALLSTLIPRQSLQTYHLPFSLRFSHSNYIRIPVNAYSTSYAQLTSRIGLDCD